VELRHGETCQFWIGRVAAGRMGESALQVEGLFESLLAESFGTES